MKLGIKFDEIITKIGNIAEKKSYKVFVVGGFVRDSILGLKSKDIDFVVLGDAIKFAEIVAKELFGIDKIISYPRFKTAKIPVKEFELEFVSARKEIYDINSRNPKVANATIEEDLQRRDFTINAMAAQIYGNNKGEIIDFYGGYNDLVNNRIIKTPLSPHETYEDDPLRMLRAIRFAGRLGFEIEKESYEAIKKNAYRIKIISVERITDEFFKILSSDDPVKGVTLLDQCDLLEIIFPEVTALKGIEIVDNIGHKDNFIHSLKVLENISEKTTNIKLRLAALMHDIGKPKSKFFNKKIGWTFHGHDDKGTKIFSKIAKRMKWSLEVTQYVSKVISLHHRPISLAKEAVTDSGVRRFLFEAGETVDDLMILCRADITTANKDKLKKYLSNFDKLSKLIIEVEEKDKLRNFTPPIDGIEIMNFFNIPQSKKIGEVKKIIVEAILDGKIDNNYDAAFKLMKQIKIDNFDKT